MTIHILRHGHAICGKRGPPGDWKDGDQWIAPTDGELKDPNIVNRVSCQDCLRGGPPVPARKASKNSGRKSSALHGSSSSTSMGFVERAPTTTMNTLQPRHHKSVRQAANAVVAVADDLGLNLVDVIAEMERVIVQETKVGDGVLNPVPPGRRGYTLENGRLVALSTNDPLPS